MYTETRFGGNSKLVLVASQEQYDFLKMGVYRVLLLNAREQKLR